jgi:hypothetical protein
MKTVTRLLALLLCFGAMHLSAQNKRLTYCNPLNLDYGYTHLKILRPGESIALQPTQP